MAEEKEKKEEITVKKDEKKDKSKPNKSLIILAVLAVILIAVGLAGRYVYRKVGESFLGALLSRTTGGKVDVDKEGEKITVTSEEGEFSFEEEGKLPDNFPADFPIYPNAKLESSWTATSDETEGLSLMWETNDSIDKVADYYKDELTSGGWKLSFTSEAEDSTTLAFEKDDTSGFIGITIEDSKTVISLTLGL
ncbi:MAG: hypothetical protein WBD86_00680 [Microgenomates group bacterium]